MRRHIYADNAATTKLDKRAFEAMVPWLLEEYGDASQLYAFARKSKRALTDARSTIAECIGAFPEEIHFTSGGTESDNWIIKSSALSDTGKRATIVSTFEHHAILRSCAAIERLGYPVAYVWPSDEGYITPDTLEKYITNDTRLVSIMFANNEIGSIQPIQELCKTAHSHGALFHTDAVQAVGHIEINAHELGVDFLSASAHKFNGPKGIGFLYIRKDVELPLYVEGSAQEHAHRAGTENVAAIVGMATALKENCDFLKRNQQHILSLERQLISRLDEAGIAYKRNGGDSRLPGLLSLSFPGRDGEAIQHHMDLVGISISSGSTRDHANTRISHVLQAIRLDESYAKGTIRISLGKDNTAEDVEELASTLIKIIT